MNKSTLKSYRALVVEEVGVGRFSRQILDRSTDDLPAGEVLIRVCFSSLNYKDGLSAVGHKGVTKNYPHTPGIDASGIVEESESDQFNPGDKVVVTGFDLGSNTPGGFGQRISVPAAWVVPLPENLSLKESMVYGTAGFTAALSLLKLQGSGISPEMGEILVTGATGGVGCMAVAMLAQEGYEVVAATGKLEQVEFLTRLGAAKVLPRDLLTEDTAGSPLLSTRWAGVVDVVGGPILATALRSMKVGGAAACCGLVASPELPVTVFPFILRGISLFGIDSTNCPMPERLKIWQKISQKWKVDDPERLYSMCSLEELDGEIERILQGKQVGRVVVDLAP